MGDDGRTVFTMNGIDVSCNRFVGTGETPSVSISSFSAHLQCRIRGFGVLFSDKDAGQGKALRSQTYLHSGILA